MATFATSGVTASWTSSTNKGFYSGTTITIKYSKYTSSGPKYVYASSSSSGGYSYKCTLSSTSNHTFTVAADTSTTSLSRTIYIIITDEYVTTTYKPNGRDSYYHTAIVPRFVAHFYKGSSTKYTYNSADHDLEDELYRSGYDIWGCTVSSTINSGCEQYPNWISYGRDLNGGTWYTVYRKEGYEETVTCYYYGGTSDKKTATATITTTDKYLYGKGSTTGGKTSSDCSVSTKCLADSSYKWIGFTTDIGAYDNTILYANPGYAYIDEGVTTVYGVYEKEGGESTSSLCYYRGSNEPNYITKTITSGTSYYYGEGDHYDGGEYVSYGNVITDCAVDGWEFVGFTANEKIQSSTSTANALFDVGNTTIYGTYRKIESMTYYPENGGSFDTSSITNLRYGKGSVTNNAPEEPVLIYDGYSFVNWATTSNGSPDTWENQWNNGVRTVYAIWQRDGNVYLGINGKWILCDTYIGVNGKWIPMQMKFGANSHWN